jgi:Zn-dependent protease with chaperone function
LIQPGSLLGFGLVFLAVSWAGSALLGGALLALRKRVRRTGPRTERALAAAALIAPPFAAATLVVSLAGLSLMQVLSGRGDHCTTHDHHLHLCLQHGGDWAENTVAVLALLLLGSVLVAGLVRRLHAYRATSELIREIERHAVARHDLPTDVSLVPSGTPLCVTAGIRKPRILISTASWNLLAVDERRAVLAHERAHIEHGDTRWRLALSLLGAFGLPGLGRRLLAIWMHAAERLCDWRASITVEEPTVVAQALVRLARASSVARAPRIAETLAFASPNSVADRVEAILDAEPDGAALGSRALTALAVAATLHSVATILFAGPLHHLLETLLHIN